MKLICATKVVDFVQIEACEGGLEISKSLGML